MNYGRFIWIYILAPLVASLFAGPLARAHCNQLNDDIDQSQMVYDDGPKQLLRDERQDEDHMNNFR